MISVEHRPGYRGGSTDRKGSEESYGFGAGSPSEFQLMSSAIAQEVSSSHFLLVKIRTDYIPSPKPSPSFFFISFVFNYLNGKTLLWFISPLSHPTPPTNACKDQGLGQDEARGPEINLGLPHGWEEPKYLSTTCYLPAHSLAGN